MSDHAVKLFCVTAIFIAYLFREGTSGSIQKAKDAIKKLEGETFG